MHAAALSSMWRRIRGRSGAWGVWRGAVWAWGWVLLHGPVPAQTAPPALPPAVEAALAQAQLPPQALSVEVVPLGGGSPRLSYRAEAPVNPASLMKLITTYAALDLLGPAYTWSTPVYVEGRVSDGVLHGTLYLQGQGDPKLVVERLWLLLRRVQQLGIREIRGDIVLDGSAFEVPPGDPGAFDEEPWRPYNVLPDALLINYKSIVLGFVPDVARGRAWVTVEPPLHGFAVDPWVPLDFGAACSDWRAQLRAELGDPSRLRFRGAYPARCGENSWAIAHADPRRYNAQAVLGVWLSLGGQLSGTVREGRVPEGLTPVLAATSPPLAEVVRDINKFSNNVMARQLFLTLGRERRGRGDLTSSRAVVEDWLRGRLGGPDPSVVLDNGAGLSREARASAAFFTRLLQSAWADPVMPEFIASLPASGRDGTLRRSRIEPGRAYLKTGSLRDVAALAGYVLGDSGQRYSFVAIVNHPRAAAARPVLEALVAWAMHDRPLGVGRSPQ
ncbi:D-alanyl-D-alanine carboxypeptidase/D-alanyl-D-alanine endopeptidase [Caldimonas taiwanensis]|uniref:D-alanyl-D-alanine carboxypeptidase/D-alanyl-D-alanine endopeptidase n=1 Tax=Caldimonas taiwanensis TaxID=307483 RepID=UPI001E49DA42|nr:D-alanyl-D-alanine carboxypeptidase/D-alanyl-D-alanine-endopeptidase [Caldimonas taiwanensis]